MQNIVTKKKINTAVILAFLMGLFSTMQIVSFFGVTIFNILLLITFVYLLFAGVHFYRLNNIILLLIASAAVTTFIAYFGSNISQPYKNKTIISFCVLMLIYLTYFLVKRNGEKDILKAFFKGFYWSALIQIGWCILQYLSWKLVAVDINNVVFNSMFHMAEETSSYRDGNVVCTGLGWHAANLLPVLLFFYFKTKKWYMKLLCIIIAFLSRSATLSIAILLCFLYSFLRYFKYLPCRKLNSNDFIFCALFLFVVLYFILCGGGQFVELMSSLIQRIKDITSTEGGNSSATHFSYYLRLPSILKRSSFITLLFGYGIDCSGYVFSKYFFQYTDLIWVVESDFVNILLNLGIVGFVLFYAFVGKLLFKSIKVSPQTSVFMAVIIICGIMYNVQFGWTILMELLLYRCVENKIDIFDGRFYYKSIKVNYQMQVNLKA